MKVTDFAPRTGAIEAYLTRSHLFGVEVGADVGAHAESLLTHCDIKLLTLVDPWPNPICEGYCEGRLARWKNKFKMCKGVSKDAIRAFEDNSLDFVYLDQEHDYKSVNEDLTLWWPKLTTGGIMALRNYGAKNEGLKRAADEFIVGMNFRIEASCAELIIFK
jgi:predicted O-methyltransferase YrrM